MAKDQKDYVLITAAYNEEKHIGATIDSILAQSKRPVKWTIVSDGSTDQTDTIVKEYAAKNSIITFLRKEKKGKIAPFVSKVQALQIGYATMQEVAYQYIGILDADVTFMPEYYKNMLSLFAREKRLGVAGGFIHEQYAGCFQSRPFNTTRSVAGAIQLFRRECYMEIGGHHFAKYGGEDTICEILARMNGWNVRAFPDNIVLHHNPSASKRGALRDSIRQGKLDYALGTYTLYAILKSIRRVRVKPYLLCGVARFAAFMWLYIQKADRDISEDAMKFVQQEQRMRIRHFFKKQ